ncbi:hypothetical protein CDV49_16195 [Haematobacter genomosp. 1]|uniref:Uncharacterized protein n=1 Tax=Haematobacter genomosp. 1 TaxID=366618 RepID=A0A212A7U7_9RHOB|nr:hypothetical protein CDV49_16195 [Haematobacter genomosp. 1]
MRLLQRMGHAREQPAKKSNAASCTAYMLRSMVYILSLSLIAWAKTTVCADEWPDRDTEMI